MSRVRRTGTSSPARLWAAALEAATEPGRAPPEVDVVDAAEALAPAALPRLVVASGPRPAVAGWPAVEERATEGALLASGAPALALRASLAFADGGGLTPLAGPVLVARRGGGPPEVAAAATAEELGRWANQGSLPALAREALAALAPRPVRAARLPGPGPLAYRDAAGAPAPLGILDVAPGAYTRADGEVLALVERGGEPAEAPPPPPGGAPSGGFPLPSALLAGAAVLLAAALLRTRAAASAAVGLAALALLGALALDLEREVRVAPRALVRVAEGAEATAAALRAAGVAVADGLQPLPCEAPRHPAPCWAVAALGAARAPPDRADGLVFDPLSPRVEVQSVRAPSRVALGAAAQVEVVVRVRRAAGEAVRVAVRPAHGATVERTLGVPRGEDDAVLGLQVPVAPLLAGEELVAVEAAVGEAADAREVALTVAPRPVQRVLLAGAPSWEARFAARTLGRGAGARTGSLIRVGATAVLATGLPRLDPLRWLGAPGALAEVDTVVLTGLPARELQGPPAAALAAHLARGGAVLFLGGEGVEALGWPRVAAAEGPRRRLTADLGTGAPGLEVEAVPPGPAAGPPGAEVLATLGGQRWMLGRAQGAGRVAVVRTQDLFRLSPPAGLGEAAEQGLFRALGWVEARAAAPPGTGALPGVSALPRARLRAEAALRGTPFLELDGPAEAARVFASLPAPAPRPSPLPLRRDALATAAALALLALEALSRRLRRRTPA